MSYQYEFTRSIRFSLTDESSESDILNVEREAEDPYAKFSILCQGYAELIEDVQNLIFKEGEVKSRLKFNYKWIRMYAKEGYYQVKRGTSFSKNYEISEVSFLKVVFDNWVKLNQELLGEMRQEDEKPKKEKTWNELARLSDINFCIQKLRGSDHYPFVNDLLLFGIRVKDLVLLKKIEDLRKSLKAFGNDLEKMNQILAPNQSAGVEVARATFNYYALDKASKNFDNEIYLQENKLRKTYTWSSDISGLWSELGLDIGFKSLSLKELYESLMDYKAKQKSEFFESIQKGMSTSDLTVRYPLFKSKTLDQFIKLRLNDQKRKDYFRNTWGFSNYVRFCNEIFKPVAVAFGIANAELLALDRERIECRLLKYWSHIFEKNGDKYLLLIPKEKRKDAKSYLNSLQGQVSDQVTLSTFNSMTLRALNKLIRKNCSKDIPLLGTNPIAVYKKVLRGECRSIPLDFEGFEEKVREVVAKEYESKEDFRIALESIAYSVKKTLLFESDIERLKKDFGAISFKITSYDLERSIVNKKEHTGLWMDFWSKENQVKAFPVRINPETRLFFRMAREVVDPKKKSNRFSKNHYGVAFTLTQNAARDRMDTAFVKIEDLSEMIKKFNSEIVDTFVKEKGSGLYSYGIDRGHSQLATLCVMRLSNESDGLATQSSIFPEIVAYRIKDDCMNGDREGSKRDIKIDKTGKLKEVAISDNPSYFIEDEHLFEVVKGASMDLTMAKLIGGKIVLNGDVKTYLALLETSAKRQIFEKFAKIHERASIEFDSVNGRFYAKSKEGVRDKMQFLNFYAESINKLLKQEEFQKNLQGYLNDLRSEGSSEDISIKRIDNLRDAITSNMVGIISFLFKKYPGLIKLENLNNIKNKSEKDPTDISRRLEWSLYRKFQKEGLVPPKIKQTILLKENRVGGTGLYLNQFGIICYVVTDDTSSTCPKCEKLSVVDKVGNKFGRHRFVCSNCGFDTDAPAIGFECIDDSDKVAAFNIAKKNL